MLVSLSPSSQSVGRQRFVPKAVNSRKTLARPQSRLHSLVVVERVSVV